MSMRQEMYFESGLLNVRAEGKFSLEEAKTAFLEIVEAVAQYQAEKVFFDGRKIDGKPQVMERYLYGEFVANEIHRLLKEHRISHAPRFAYVLTEPVGDPQRLGETVALNRGMVVKTFETPEEALGWLHGTPANSPDAGDA